jgi:pimeloyl-ACP methyl ester carboxylesterase
VNHHVNQFLKLPAFPIGIEIRYLIEQRDGFDGDLLDPLKAVNRVECPIFFIAGAEDKRMPPSIAEQLRAASRNPRSDLLIVEGATTRVHGHSYQAEPELYVRKIDEFLKTAVGG